MTRLSIAVAALAIGLAATGAMAQSTHAQQRPPAAGEAPRDAFGGPPSPMCHESAGVLMPIHCLHNMLWLGSPYYGYEYDGQFARPPAPRR